MKKYRVDVFKNVYTKTYFDSKEDALQYGKEQAEKGNAVFLMKYLLDGKYDVVQEIKA